MKTTIRLKDHWKEQRLFLSRLFAIGTIILLLASVLIWRLFQLQIVEHQFFADLSQGNRLRIEPLPPTRGLIFDRNGVVLAENLPDWELIIIPEEIIDLEESLRRLEELELIDSTEHSSLTELIRSHRGFERVRLANLTETQAARFAARRHHFPGVDIQEGLVRNYPFGELTGHAVGYVARISPSDLDEFARGSLDRSDYAATSLIGRSGIERSYETVLHGSVGYRQQVVNAQGRVLLDSTVSAGDVLRLEPSQGGIETRWPIPGDNVVLGLDIHLQSVAQRAMDGFRGAVVAIDPATGDVLAMVSAPGFDPNRFSVGLSREDFRALNSDPDKPLFHRALAGSYPPGSTIKPFLGLAALHYEIVEPERRNMCPGYFVLPGYSHRYRDWKSQGHGPVDLHQAIVQSCDVYFYKLALGLGIDNMSVFLRDIGFGVKTGIDVSGENSGLIPTREWKQSQFSKREDQVWFPGETVITGIGQGFVLVTPLQLAHTTAMLAMGGQRFQPRLVMAIENGTTGKVIESDSVRLNVMSDIDESHWQEIEEAMVGVTEDSQGTGRVAMRGTPYSVAGKTGTAQVFSLAQDQEYDEEEIDERLRDHRLFIAYAPLDNPAIAVAVVVENGGGGSTTAATVTRKVLDAYLLGENNVVQQY